MIQGGGNFSNSSVCSESQCECKCHKAIWPLIDSWALWTLDRAVQDAGVTRYGLNDFQVSRKLAMTDSDLERVGNKAEDLEK